MSGLSVCKLLRFTKESKGHSKNALHLLRKCVADAPLIRKIRLEFLQEREDEREKIQRDKLNFFRHTIIVAREKNEAKKMRFITKL